MAKPAQKLALAAPPNEMVVTALDLASRGLRVFPVHWPADGGCSCGKDNCAAAGKHPLVADWPNLASIDAGQILPWWERWPTANVGVVAGDGIVIIDVDGPEGVKTLQRLEDDHEPLPTTFAVATGGGRHLYLRVPKSTLIRNWQKRDDLPGLDLRGDGGYVVGPGSLHISGRRYAIIQDAPIADAPGWMVEWMRTAPKKKPKKAAEDGAKEKVAEGDRHKKLLALAGKLRHDGIPQEVITTTLLEFNRLKCDPPKGEAEVIKIAEYVAEKPAGTDAFLGTDSANARKLLEISAPELMYVPERKAWFLWTGEQRWVRDDAGRILKHAEKVSRAWLEMAHAEPEKQRAAELFAASKRIQEVRKAEAMFEWARPDFRVPIAELDKDPYLLCLTNGVLDLHTLEFREGKPEDRLTQQAGVAFDRTAACPHWIEFLNLVMQGSQKMVDYLQRCAGYCLTGDVSEQAFFFCHGVGANGKTTFLETLARMLGSYAGHVEAELIMRHKRTPQSASEDIAKLHGKRFVWGIEPREGRQIDEARLKQFSGTDTISARHLFEREFDFKAAFKLLIGMNCRPVISEMTHGFWRKIQLVPWEFTIPDEQRILDYEAKYLDPELPGILNWAIDGLKAWREMGLQPPEQVRSATAAYRAEQDEIEDWLRERTHRGHETLEARGHFCYQDYCEWTRPAKPMSRKTFDNRLEIKSFRSKRTMLGLVWHGFELLPGTVENLPAEPGNLDFEEGEDLKQ